VPPISHLMMAHPASDVSVGQVATATYQISPVMAAAVTLRNG